MSQMHTTDALRETEIDRLYKSLRLSRHTATSLAREIGLHRNTVDNYLHGKSPLDWRTRLAWAHATHVPVMWLETGRLPNGSPDPTGLPRLDSNQQPSGYRSRLLAAVA